MDDRIRKRIERTAGFPLETFPDEGMRVLVSTARTDEPKNRILVQRIVGCNGVLVTGIPWTVQAVSGRLESMTSWELFSPLGIAEIKRALPPADAESFDETYGFDFVLIKQERFCPAKSRYEVLALKKKDIPTEQFDLRMAERHPSETDDFTWAFACYHNEPNMAATELAPFGPRCASIAIVIWNGGKDIATFGVGTEELLRGQGYALAVASAATQWILDQKAIAWYGAYADNIPSLRIARRLGFSLVHRSFRA